MRKRDEDEVNRKQEDEHEEKLKMKSRGKCMASQVGLRVLWRYGVSNLPVGGMASGIHARKVGALHGFFHHQFVNGWMSCTIYAKRFGYKRYINTPFAKCCKWGNDMKMKRTGNKKMKMKRRWRSSRRRLKVGNLFFLCCCLCCMYAAVYLCDSSCCSVTVILGPNDWVAMKHVQWLFLAVELKLQCVLSCFRCWR